MALADHFSLSSSSFHTNWSAPNSLDLVMLVVVLVVVVLLLVMVVIVVMMVSSSSHLLISYSNRSQTHSECCPDSQDHPLISLKWWWLWMKIMRRGGFYEDSSWMLLFRFIRSKSSALSLCSVYIDLCLIRIFGGCRMDKQTNWFLAYQPQQSRVFVCICICVWACSSIWSSTSSLYNFLPEPAGS